MTLPPDAAPADLVAAAPVLPARRGMAARLLRDSGVLIPLAVLIVLAVLAAVAPLLTGADPARTELADILAPPSAAHPLGVDGVGRDILARLLYGARISLAGAALAVVVALVVGGPLGLIAGFYRGWFDSVSSWVFNLIMAIPGIVVLLVVLFVFGSNTFAAMAALGVLLAPSVFRLIRASVTSVRDELYIDAARVAGLSDPRILRRHILRVAIAPLIIQAAQLFGVGIVVQAGLEFLGLGSPSQPSWGSMLNDAFANIYIAPSLLVWPSLAIVVSVIMTSLLANAVRDTLQGRGRERISGTHAQTVRLTAPSTADGGLLRVSDLHVSYRGRDVVKGVSFGVEAGEVLGIVGETGSGKSQSAFAVLGLLGADAVRSAARLSFDGIDLLGLREREMNRLRGSRIGYIPQEPMSNLDPSFTIGSQLVEPMRRHLRISRHEARRQVLDLLNRVGIRNPPRVYASYPHELSGGMAQRVLIAGAVSCGPDLLIADEPTTALDVTLQADVLELMRSLQQERGMGMIIVTHDLGVVADICDRVVVMRDGNVVETADAGDLFTAAGHDYTRQLLASSLVDAPLRAPLEVGA